MDPGFALRERFHLQVLRQLAPRLATRAYAVKGGICLRFFHRSPRLSEDMDVDITPAMPVKTLQTNVDAVLMGHALITALQPHGVTAIESTKPKQTETTQRWKVGLLISGGRVSTCLEFSRRQDVAQAEKGVPNAEVLRHTYVAPFVVAYYGATDMVTQKILALSSMSRNAARDLFDLDHLWSHSAPDETAIRQRLTPSILQAAKEKVHRFKFTDFREQVIPYLPDDLQTFYEKDEPFQALQQRVEHHLAALFA